MEGNSDKLARREQEMEEEKQGLVKNSMKPTRESSIWRESCSKREKRGQNLKKKNENLKNLRKLIKSFEENQCFGETSQIPPSEE